MRSGPFPLRISAPLTSLALTGLLLLGGCADGAGPAGDLGIEGASCVRSPDCASPLQCLGGVCTDPEADPGPTPGAGLFEGSDDDDQPGSIADAFVAADVTPDVPHVTEILEWADLAEHDVFPDGTHSTQPFDTSQTEIFSDCEVLGIADEWVGTFLGEIAFDLDTGGLVYPETGTISVVGELSFDITCIDSKLVVVGLMSGSGAVVGRTE